MTDEKRPLKVFLCHAHSDKEAVFALYDRLSKDGVDVWLDKKSLIPGQEWEFEIRKAVRESDVVIVCLSKQFKQKGFRQREIIIALEEASLQPEGEIFIIPARLEECDSLESLKKWHWVDLFEPEGYDYLMRALRARANKIGVILQSKTGWLPRIQSPKKDKVVTDKKPRFTHKSAISQIQKPFGQLNTTESIRPKKWRTEYIIAIIGAAATILAALIGILPQIIKPAPEPTATFTATITATPPNTQIPSITVTTLPPSETPKPSSNLESILTPTEVYTPTISPTPLPKVYDPHPEIDDYHDAFGVPMRLVLAGEFTMGRDDGRDDSPAHTVDLPAFYMDKYEVTNILYKTCVDAGMCKLPLYGKSSTRDKYYDNSQYANYPILYVDWNMANSYCGWRDARLPTEAEWEKAARGTDNRTYPWGDTWDKTFARFGGANAGYSKDTSVVGDYPRGKSPYGLYDMAGNVREWVLDWYDSYPDSIYSNRDFGEEYRVLRGGSWYTFEIGVSFRDLYYAKYSKVNDIGFRCARSVP